ncbi:putative ferric-chelate reductase 1 [Amphiura filiformis]|uniref:putative ferric-chelate reductase 1 n=1 Tax=Amphiura filiformis TaxID=82378 RepID=UPI003B212DC6
MNYVTILVMLMAHEAFSFPNNPGTTAPEWREVCQSLTLSNLHGTRGPLSDPVPYQVSLNRRDYVPDQELIVTLEGIGQSTFKGFIIQARAIPSDEIIGTFTSEEGQQQGRAELYGCQETWDTAAHNSNVTKSRVSFR